MEARSLRVAVYFTAMAASWGCTSILGIDKDYRSNEDPGGAGGSPTGSGAGGAGGTGGASGCGDGALEDYEECDDGNGNAGDGCSDCVFDCTLPAGLVGDAFEDETTGHCYLYLHDAAAPEHAQPWYDARYRCLANGYELAAVTSSAELDLIRAKISADVWIGGNDQATENVFEWSNGEPWNYASWASYEPNNTGGGQHCVEMTVNGLNDEECSRLKDYVCERHPPGSCGDGVVDAAEECDDQNELSGDGCKACKVECEELPFAGLKLKDPRSHHCYLYENNSVTWAKGQANCELVGFHLATMSSTSERAFIVGVPDVFNAWIGATDQLYDTDWRWSNGEPWEFIPWSSDPANGPGKDCLRFQFEDLIAADCGEFHPYLCERAPAGKRSP